MTEKEKIIIDGVDVSGCIHLDDWKHCNCCNDLVKTIYPKATKCHIEEDLRCETYPNCYYKQLVRKTQECEELKALVANSKFAEFVLGECELNFPIMQKYANAFKDIKEEVSALHCSTCVFHKGTTHELADRIQKTYIKVLEIITSVEGEQK